MAFQNSKSAPKLARWLMTKFVDESLIEELMGDLEELYQDRLAEKNKTYAKLMYLVDAFHLSYGFSSFSLFKTQNTMMIKNMMKIAWRNAIGQKQFTILNILGLSLGITACLLIGLYVQHEKNFDRFHVDGDRIFRVNQPNIWGDWDEQMANLGPNVATAMREDIPEFESVTRVMSAGSQTVKIQDPKGAIKSFQERNYLAAENNFFEFFNFPLIAGDPKTALSEPNSILLTQETAERYFGYEDPMGKIIEFKHWDDTWRTFKVKGVFADLPTQTHINFDLIASISSYDESMKAHGWKWIWTIFATYGKVKPGTNLAALEEKLQQLPAKWAPPTTEKIFNQSFDEFTAGKPWKMTIQPITDIYLSETVDSNPIGPLGLTLFVKILMIISVLILALSCINFMNLSTARSANRAKEVGIRKVLGSMRVSLITQFIFESILFVVVGTILGLILTYYSLDLFNEVSMRELSLLQVLSNPYSILGLIGFILTLGILSGSYPAFYLSSFRPIHTLKGKAGNGFKGKKIRNGLVIFQFTISIALIVCTFFVQKQLRYVSDMDLGFQKNNILQIHNIEQLGFKYNTDVLKTKLLQNPAITQVGKSFGIPTRIWSGDRYKAAGGEEVVQFRNLRTEKDYLELLDVELLAGRLFDKSLESDKYKVVINETAAKNLGWNEGIDFDPVIGKKLAIASGDEQQMEIIGVTKDFNFNSVRNKIDPLLLIHQDNDHVWDYARGLAYFSLKIDPKKVNTRQDLQLIIEYVEQEIAALDPSLPFEYSFLDENFEKTFRNEQRMGVVMNIFTFMAVVIACLGLFGLAAFSAEQRTKELGIRKVLGAKVSHLVITFSSEFTLLVIISIAIATPISYWLIDQWLDNFAYQTAKEIWVFALAGLCALTIAFITIGYQSLMAAFRNPVEVLKDE